MLLFVSFDGDGVHRTLERLAMQDDIAELRRLANSHADAEQRLAQWAINHGGTAIDDHNVQVPPEALRELPTEQQKYHDLTEHTLSVGVGMKLSEAKRALKISQKRGGARVTFWNPSMQDELDRADMNDVSVEQLAAQFEEPTRSAITADDLKDGQLDGGTVFLKHEPLAKMSTPAGMPFSGEQQSAVAPQKAVGPTQAQQRMADKMAAFAQQPQPTKEEAAQAEEQQNKGDTEKAAIARALMALKQQIPVLEQIKQQKPETYAAIMGLVQAMAVAVQAKLIGKPKDNSKEEKVEKAESKHCKCEAYKFPHRRGSGSCKNRQTELKKREDDWESVLSSLPKHPDVPDYGRLKFMGSGNHLGGAGKKSLFADEQGNQYVFRHAVNKHRGTPEPFRAAGQVAVSHLQRALKPFSPALNAEIHNGEPGVMQQFIPAKPFQWKPPHALTDIEKEDLAAEHIIDWTTSQHDSHAGNLLSTPDGRLVGIDKEQAFRWFGRDSLDHEYHPNEQYGEQEPYYNTFWRAFSNGEVDFDPRKMAPYFDKLEAFPDEEYADLLKPYARLTRRGDDFIQAAIARKNNARKDFEEFISKLYERRTGQPGRFSFATGWVHGNGGDLNKMDLTPDNKRRKTLIHKPMQMDGEEGYPVGTQIYGVGKVKVMHSDEWARGIPNPKETSWVEMRDGMIMSQDGHPISSRNANGK